MYNRKRRFESFLFIVILQLSQLLWNPQTLSAAENETNNPRCVGSGPVTAPTDESYCGCTWGAVYYRGQPVAHAPVSILFKEGELSRESVQSADDTYPVYSLSAFDLGAKLNDVLTVTTDFAGVTVARTFRARPDHEKNQEVALVVPEMGVWKNLLAVKNSSALLIDDNVVWSGGQSGLLSLNLSTGISTTYQLPWAPQKVVALAIAQNHHLWVAGAHDLAEFDGTSWHKRNPPFASTIRTLYINPLTNALWVGGGDNGSALAVYNAVNSSWQTITVTTGRVEAITADKNGDVWVGSRKGLYRHDHNSASFVSGWTTYQVEDGLGSDDIRALASDPQYLWVGSAPYDGDTDSPKGGISRFRLSDASWQVFTTTHGLPADADGSAALIHSLGVDAKGRVWAGMADGVYFMPTSNYWLNDNPQSGQPVVAIASNASNVFIVRELGIEALEAVQQVTTPPIVQMNQLSVTVDYTATLTISATVANSTANSAGVDNNQIVGWEWVSDLAGPLCTSAESCVLPASILGAGKHAVSLRVQNSLGTWSEKSTMQVVVNAASPEGTNPKVYLPLVTR